ncbi:hypothetical protein PSPTOT1_1523 [Pseudomonas syringae pv. tomato T1]|nr:hypothetical protein PSPTOT1_1523 [Pseudomonas syringae pv. tomato T1]TES59512.1 hypothetical protein E2N91_08360 [Pseudomonas syringae pv. tomato]
MCSAPTAVFSVHPSAIRTDRSRFRKLCELWDGSMRDTHRSHEIQTTSGMLPTTSAVHVLRM